MAHGGKREGAGRKSDAERAAIKNASSQRLAQFADKALRDLDAIYEAQKDLALGIYFEGCEMCARELGKCKCKEGPVGVRIYRRPPDQRAGAELLQHAKGRAAQAQQVQAETDIRVELGCRKCGATDPVIPRPPQKRGKDDPRGETGRDGDLPGDAGGAGGAVVDPPGASGEAAAQ